MWLANARRGLKELPRQQGFEAIVYAQMHDYGVTLSYWSVAS